MGVFYSINCGQCGYKQGLSLDVGMLFPMVYQKTVEAARNGELGEEIQKFFSENPDGAIDCSNVAAVCSECGNITNVQALTMYLPKKDGSTPDKRPANVWSTAMHFDKESYVAPWDLGEYYEFYAKYPHKCPKCGGEVEIFNKQNIGNHTFKCPNCGNSLHAQVAGLWD